MLRAAGPDVRRSFGLKVFGLELRVPDEKRRLSTTCGFAATGRDEVEFPKAKDGIHPEDVILCPGQPGKHVVAAACDERLPKSF
jgi:hypothetical protein